MIVIYSWDDKSKSSQIVSYKPLYQYLPVPGNPIFPLRRPTACSAATVSPVQASSCTLQSLPSPSQPAASEWSPMTIFPFPASSITTSMASLEQQAVAGGFMQLPTFTFLYRRATTKMNLHRFLRQRIPTQMTPCSTRWRWSRAVRTRAVALLHPRPARANRRLDQQDHRRYPRGEGVTVAQKERAIAWDGCPTCRSLSQQSLKATFLSSNVQRVHVHAPTIASASTL